MDWYVFEMLVCVNAINTYWCELQGHWEHLKVLLKTSCPVCSLIICFSWINMNLMHSEIICEKRKGHRCSKFKLNVNVKQSLVHLSETGAEINHLLFILKFEKVSFFSLTCLLLRLNIILTFEGKYPFPLRVVKDRRHANHWKTNLERVRGGPYSWHSNLESWFSCQFQFGSPFTKSLRGGVHAYLTAAPAFTIFSGRPGTRCFQHSRQLNCIMIYVTFHQTLRHVKVIIM